MWTFDHPTVRIAAGKTLRINTPRSAKIHWTSDGWMTAHDLEMRDTGVGCRFGDLATTQLVASARVDFTFLWCDRWEGKDFRVTVEALTIPRGDLRG
jgi:glucoamylase